MTQTVTMISVEEAKKRLLENTPAPDAARMFIGEAAELILAEALYSPLDVPPFRQSSMDGYALNYRQLQESKKLRVRHSLQAGATELPALQPGEAMRIFTGAPVPPGADTVVMQEKVTLTGNTIEVLDEMLQEGSNVRAKGSQTACGTLAAPAGTLLTAGCLGYLASLGFAELKVYAPPATGIVVTGNELAQPGVRLQAGQVYESNTFFLGAALGHTRITPQFVQQVNDNKTAIFDAISQGLSSCRLLLITGGISVGEHDYVHEALQKAGVETIFYKVRQKPGKPLYCGRKKDCLVFGLPGNPASVLCCYYQYVLPAIRKMMGKAPLSEQAVYLPLAHDVQKPAGLTHFLKARANSKEVQVLQGQESYKMNAFVESNCLVELPQERTAFSTGTQVRVHPFIAGWH